MDQRIIHEIGRSPRLDVINVLKKTEGLSVRELAAKMGMSYMGTKQHCQQLHKDGYLDTWRKPREGVVGRPEMLYRLTKRSEALFPKAANPLAIGILEASAGLYGPSAPEKLLFAYFEQMCEGYIARIKGSNAAERALWMSRLRDADGYMADLHESESSLEIVESHSPICDLFEKYPIVKRLEEEMFTKAIGTAVKRTESTATNSYRCVFRIG